MRRSRRPMRAARASLKVSVVDPPPHTAHSGPELDHAQRRRGGPILTCRVRTFLAQKGAIRTPMGAPAAMSTALWQLATRCSVPGS
jgi:hypothetical protein